MTTEELEVKLFEFLKESYPDIDIKVIDTANKVRQVYFTDSKFEMLYPQQRYHILIHLIPSDFFDQNLKQTEWFELAPNEIPEDLDYYDQETIAEIKETILSILKNKVDFVSLLDEKFMINGVKCFGDFRHSKIILTDLKFSDEDQFDIFHVLMNEGGYCDCEILLNVFPESKFAQKHWIEK